MATAATELTGVVQIDVERSIGPNDVSVGLGEMVERVRAFALPETGKKRTPAETRKALKTKEIPTLDKLSQALVVTDDDSFQKVGGLVAEAAGIIKAIEEDIAPEKKTASDLHKLLCDREAIAQAPYEWVKKAGDANMNAYRMKQRREAEELARKEQEAAQAEQRRLQAEADNKFMEQQRLEKLALEARRAGDMATARQARQEATVIAEQAEVIQERAQAVVEEVVHAPVSVAKVAGRVEKWPWFGKIVEPLTLIRAVASGEYPLEHIITVRGVEQKVPLIEFNDAVIQYYAKRLEANARIPGVTFTEELRSAQRTK